MTEAVVSKSSLAIAVSAVRAAQAIAPTVIAVSCLYGVLGAYSIPPTPYFHVLAITIVLLTLLLMRQPASNSANTSGGSLPVSIALLMRWLIVLAALFALGYVSKYSAYYPRRIV